MPTHSNYEPHALARVGVMRGLALAAIAAVIAAILGLGVIGAQTAEAAAFDITVSQSFPISLVVNVPCAVNGAGEDVFLSGSLHDLFHITLDNTGGFHLSQSDNPQGVSGVGLTTGAKYQATGITRSSAFEAAPVFPIVETFVNNFRIIGQGPDNNFLVHEDAHVTVNADGTLTSFHDNFSITCQ